MKPKHSLLEQMRAQRDERERPAIEDITRKCADVLARMREALAGMMAARDGFRREILRQPERKETPK